MSLPHLSLADVRNPHLAVQGLLNKPRRRTSSEDVPVTISHTPLLQIDTINIVAHSPCLVFFSRLGNYLAQQLGESLVRGELMKYWAHEAYLMPRSDLRLTRHRMLASEKMGWKYEDAWTQEHAAETAQLTQHIHDRGLIRPADFEHPREGASGWWERKPCKRHLGDLFTVGKVMVIERRNFQRIYDLIHRVMPEWNDERDLVPQVETETVMLDDSVYSLGIFREQWLVGCYRLKRPALTAWCEVRVEQQQIIAVHIEKLGNPWLHTDLLSLLEHMLAGKFVTTHSTILSSFGLVVWDRKRTRQLFDFSYRLERYILTPKHQYDYFILPLLRRGQLVGRMDAKVHRQTGILEVISPRLQEGIKPTTTLQKRLYQVIIDFANRQQATRVTLGHRPQGLFTDRRAGWEIGPVAQMIMVRFIHP